MLVHGVATRRTGDYIAEVSQHDALFKTQLMNNYQARIINAYLGKPYA